MRNYSEYDFMCPYYAVERVWRARLGVAPPRRGRIPAGHPAAKQPLLVSTSVAPWHTNPNPNPNPRTRPLVP